jgi:tetratricopeptide (TPR) repeat protein
LAEKHPEEAIQVLQPALKAHPNDPGAQYRMGLLLDATGQYEGSQAFYERAAVQGLEEKVCQTDSQSVRQVCATSVAADPGVPPAPGTPLGNSAVPASVAPTVSARFLAPVETTDRDAAGESDGSPDRSDPSVNNEPTSADEIFHSGCEALSQEDPRLALAYFQRAIAEKPDDPQIPISAAVTALRHNRPEMAVDILEGASRQFPRSAAIQRILGVSYYRRGDYPSSQVALQQALSLDKSSALSYFLMGCTLAKLGQNEAAEQHFRQARLLDPKYATVR